MDNFSQAYVDEAFRGEFEIDQEINEELTKEFKGGNNVDLQRPTKKLRKRFKKSTISKYQARKFEINKNEIMASSSGFSSKA